MNFDKKGLYQVLIFPCKSGARKWRAYWQTNSWFLSLGQLHAVSDFIYVHNIKSTSEKA